MNEVLANSTTEPLSHYSGFYTNQFVVPKCTGGLQPILNLELPYAHTYF